MKSLFRGAFLRGVSASVFAITLAGCAATPHPLDRPGDVPPAFTAPQDKTAPIWPKANWWANFGASELAPLETTAQKENLDIAVAAAQVLQAEANDGVALASLFPSLSGSMGVTRVGSSVPTFNDVTGTTSGTRNAFTAALNASYHQGLLGTQFFQLQASRETLRGQRYAAAVTGLTVTSEVANEYFMVLELREAIAIANSNVAAAKRILAIVQAKVNSGVLSNLDLAQQQALLAQQESTLPSLIQEEKEARYSLAVLLGRPPEHFDIQAQNLDGIDTPAVQPGLPSELLLRNPTVAEAEAQLYAAHADVNAARSTYFPSLDLTGSAGYGPSTALDNLFATKEFAWSIGAGITQPIFDGGAIHARNDLADAQQMQMIASYRKAVFTAFQDVEQSLDTLKSSTDQLALITTETKADAEAFRIAELEYREGTIDIVTLLTTEQSLFNAQQSLVQTKLARLEAGLALYVALGGGWDQKSDDAAYKNQLDWWPL